METPDTRGSGGEEGGGHRSLIFPYLDALKVDSQEDENGPLFVCRLPWLQGAPRPPKVRRDADQEPASSKPSLLSLSHFRTSESGAKQLDFRTPSRISGLEGDIGLDGKVGRKFELSPRRADRSRWLHRPRAQIFSAINAKEHKCICASPRFEGILLSSLGSQTAHCPH